MVWCKCEVVLVVSALWLAVPAGVGWILLVVMVYYGQYDMGYCTVWVWFLVVLGCGWVACGGFGF